MLCACQSLHKVTGSSDDGDGKMICVQYIFVRQAQAAQQICFLVPELIAAALKPQRQLIMWVILRNAEQ